MSTPTGRGAGLGRSSRMMAVGTIASRGTGFLRNAGLAAALGIHGLGNAYNVANTIPNIIYELLLGGVLTSVVVPLLVQAAKDSADNGEDYAQRLLSLVIFGLLGAVVLVVVIAPYLLRIYARGFTSEQFRLAVLFARFFLPQILFYGVGAMLGAILNTRGRFAPVMWAPVLNNLVVLVTVAVFFALPGSGHAAPGTITTAQTLTLALGTTLGIVAQTMALLPSLRASGFSFRLRFDLRGTGLGLAGRLAGWVLLYVVANQIGLLVVVNLANAADGYSAYVFAFALFQLPYAVVAVSVITALLPRMSRSAVDGALTDLSADLSRGLRLSAAVLVPAALGLIVLATPIATVVYAHGNTSVSDARLIGHVLAAFAVALLPFSAFQLQLRAFYALRDTRTPALINIVVNLVNIAVDAALFATLSGQSRVVGLALGYGASYAVGVAASSIALRRRLGGLDGYRLTQTFVRLLVAASVAASGTAMIRALLPFGTGWATALAVVAIAGGVGVVVFAAVANRMRVPEVRLAVASVLRRVR